MGKQAGESQEFCEMKSLMFVTSESLAPEDFRLAGYRADKQKPAQLSHHALLPEGFTAFCGLSRAVVQSTQSKISTLDP